MPVVKVRKEALLEVMRSNRDAHHSAYEAAVKGYTEAMIRWHREQEARLLAGKDAEQSARMPVPREHTGDYDTLIGMLEMDVSETVELEFHEYQNYVQDRWGWSGEFAATSAAYISSGS